MIGLSQRVSKWQKNVLVLAMLAYLVAVFGWTFAFLKYFGPFINHVILAHVLTLWNTQLAELVGTSLGEAFFPLILYLFVVRPLQLKPILNTNRRQNLLGSLVSITFIVILFLFLTPLHKVISMATFLTAITFIGVGFAEEYSFRGVLTRVFRDKLGIVWATLIASLLFSSAHWAEWLYKEHVPLYLVGESFLTIFVMAILLTVMAWRSGTLWWAIMIHALNDFEAQIDPSHYSNWGFALILMVCGVIGAEVLRFVAKTNARGEDATVKEVMG